jgi:hypothetical protein
MLTFFRPIVVSIALTVTASAGAEEFEAATYHNAQCMRCHDNGVYTRENRRVQSFPALEAQVARCDANLGAGLFPDDLSLLVGHLNTQFYKFEK